MSTSLPPNAEDHPISSTTSPSALLPLPPTQPFLIGTSTTRLSAPHLHAARFASDQALVCNAALDDNLLMLMQRLVMRASFIPEPVEHIGQREMESPGLSGAALTLALRRTPFLRWIEALTQCGPIHTVKGKLAQTRAGTPQALDWHDDLNDGQRRLAITIDLSPAHYEGGLFELCHKSTREVIFRHRHLRPGTALIFRIAPHLVHRLQPVTAGGPRRVYTGWFMDESSV